MGNEQSYPDENVVAQSATGSLIGSKTQLTETQLAETLIVVVLLLKQPILCTIVTRSAARILPRVSEQKQIVQYC
ncbi:unnamed protein product [Arctia plantaginis]|uniref:Uncharacterized protein n=1 Tax=Arctia plantaginis TaxID=874455 RepID=A0A8S1BDS5_ARCPL|nr:unnamed protein product [Arctia plantaginis]CAB3257991.1 unnamed protein product [Arctia plantaginis]